jgi:hypothetical protein
MEIDMRDIRDLDRVLGNLALLTGKSMDEVLSKGSWLAAQSAAVATKQAGPNRKSSQARSNRGAGGPGRDSAGRFRKGGGGDISGNGTPWWSIGKVEIWKKGVPMWHHFRKQTTFKRARKKPRAGLARNVWRASGSKFGRMTISKNRGVAMSHSETRVRKAGGFIAEIEMSNNLNYIKKVAPNSARLGIHKATKKIEGFFIPQAERKLQRQFYKIASAIR